MIVDVTFRNHTVKMNVSDPDCPIQQCWLKGSFYEQPMLAFIYDNRKEIGTDSLWIDVGAYVGNHSVFFAEICGADVQCFEPVYWREMVDNIISIKRNGCYWPESWALSNVVSEVLINLEKNGGMTRIYGKGKFKSWCCRLDGKRIAKDENVTLIKIDVEGHELEVLKGSVKTLKRHKPWLFVEIIGDTTAVDEFLLPLGYNRTHVFNATPTHLYKPT